MSNEKEKLEQLDAPLDILTERVCQYIEKRDRKRDRQVMVLVVIYWLFGYTFGTLVTLLILSNMANS